MQINRLTNTMTRLLMCVVISLCLSTGLRAQAIECQTDNADLQAMPLSSFSFLQEQDVDDKPDTAVDDTDTHRDRKTSEAKQTTNKKVKIQIKLADNNQTRGAGFQRVCASTIAAMPILFVFDTPLVPSFHMHNVVAPIDIAFIDQQGKIESIQSMQPYSVLLTDKPLYRPGRPVIAALEARPGFFTENKLKVGAIIYSESLVLSD